MKYQNIFLFWIVFVLILSSCASYKQGIMMLTEDETFNPKSPENISSNYLIQPNDRLEIELFLQGGESLIDPYFRPGQIEGSVNSNLNNRRALQYLVNWDGTVVLPKIGECSLINKTLKEAEALLKQKYSSFYEDAYIQVRFVNKRVVFLGANGGVVIPLTHENTKLSEALANYGQLNTEIKANNIRVLRGDDLYTADFSTHNSFMESDIILENGDIIYVEPVVRPFVQSMRDYGPVINIFTGLISVSVLIFTLISQP